MPDFSNAVVSLASGLAKRANATAQGGLLSGVNPTTFTTSDPLRLWIIQMGIIIMMGQLLSLFLGKIKQPKVIAEVLGGILLGPTAMGRIPGFTQRIFPASSLSYLSLVANIGLCLFLFIVGLEIDASVIKRNVRSSIFIALSAMALSFGLGSAISVPLYHNFIPSNVQFLHFMLFIGVTFSVTAFPVLCRILSALKLLDTTVGAIVLSAGVCNDVVGWSLLALAVALVNATSGLTALWILLTCVAFTIFLMWPVRLALLWLARFTGSTENGPTMFFMTVSILVLWACAFFTDIVGVNAIFGAFLAGIVIPREGGLAISLTEKLEDMVTIVFLPLYFTISGLSTNLGLLNNGITWAFTIAIICLDFSGKFSACTITARITGMTWRESATVGSLMSCKGLIELIVLNIGLAAGILTQRVFSMFVFEALVLTFITTPLVSTLYPPERRVRAPVGGISRASTADEDEDKSDRKSPMTEDQPWRSRFTVVLDKFDHMSGMLVATQLVCPPSLETPSFPSAESTRASDKIKMPAASVDALRLIELSDRTSDVMKSSAVDTLIHTDPILSVFRTFGELNDIPVSLSLSIVPYDDIPNTVVDHAKRHGSELVLLPWLSPSSNFGDPSEDLSSPRNDPNPFEAFFGGSKNRGKSATATQSQFVRRVFAESKTDVALFIDPAGAGTGSARHIFCPFFGGPDDRLALEFVVQLCSNPRMSATVVRMSKSSAESAAVERPSLAHLEEKASLEMPNLGYQMPVPSNVVFPDTIYGQANTEMVMQSETANSILWARYANSQPSDDTPSSLRSALSRITFSEHSSPIPLHSAIQQASAHKPVLVVVGRSRRLAGEDHTLEVQKILEERGSVGQDVVRKTIGDPATAFVASGCATAVVVLQASNVDVD
ncbi:Sodium/hydrogen exchanger family-domain-containing protein [Suillus clintonianus]|uniref:Sodium/hydrogen exchanger family-domain-containing protein n=1 Tax=Suillus clintonianus TaxID=1904413 RepID=UPI001B86A0DB|nr:Sodium/hydrogen exchanger family-domain-containing protein [Suillus clintonianus]KAG2120237.1 Sodium/hydrogen exchanger family-domain-containing protein [Suillus clintonianus]